MSRLTRDDITEHTPRSKILKGEGGQGILPFRLTTSRIDWNTHMLALGYQLGAIWAHHDESLQRIIFVLLSLCPLNDQMYPDEVPQWLKSTRRKYKDEE